VPASLDDAVIREALAHVGASPLLRRDVEISIVGGAAGILIHALPHGWTTSDVDAIHFKLAQDRDAVLDAAGEVAAQFQLPADWLNDWGGLFAWTLPDDWQTRRVHVGRFGRLDVYAVSRRDLIAMKFLSHRPSDLEHLNQLNLAPDDLQFVSRYLEVLAQRFPSGAYPSEAGKIGMAVQYVRSWEVK
jgi:hypothetical protein